jgi:hypothetical protein
MGKQNYLPQLFANSVVKIAQKQIVDVSIIE